MSPSSRLAALRALALTALVAVLAGCGAPPAQYETGSGTASGVRAERGSDTPAVASTSADPDAGDRIVPLRVSDIAIEGGAKGVERQAWLSALPAAVERARTVWGKDLRGPVSLVLPQDQTEYLLFADGDAEGIALTKFEPPRRPGGPEFVRIVVAPNEQLVREARVGVLAHELAHVAQRSYGTHGTGTWVLEGAAMWTQNLGSPPETHAETRLLRERARNGQLPTALPADGSFTGGEDSRLAYQQAWTTYLFLLQRGGRAQLVLLARDIAEGKSAAAALQSRFGMDEATLVQEWSSWVSSWT